MKKLTTIIIAIALILGMSQCKKNVETITPSNLGEAVHITVNVDDGGKHIVYPGTGAYVFENNDKLYVGNNGKYVGTLTYADGAFSGPIYPTSTEDYLHFYFVGGLTPSDTPEAGTTTDFTVSIADQHSQLPVLSYAHSTQKYVDGTTTYGCTLLNKCGLVEFVLTDGTSESVTVADMLTVANISFANPDNAISSTGTKDVITLNSQSETSKWAILLPTSAATSTTATIAGNNYDVVIPVINYNDYLHNSTAVEVDNATPAVDYVFTVDDHGTTVHFSPGNLQYKPSNSNGSWQFAAQQHGIIGNANSNISPSYDGWLDLFGWGTGDNPIKGYDYSYNSTFKDWGDYCGDPTGNGYNWRTLSTEEWQYLFNSRTDHDDKYGSATVNDIPGIVLLPDNWTLPMGCSFTAGMNEWDNNEYDADAWPLMENNGAVFLPAAGTRNGTDVLGVGDGYYWSSSAYDDDNAWYVYFDNNEVGSGNYYRGGGQSVRLVR